MSEWLRAAGPAVGNHLWQSTAFAAAAWVVTLLLRRNQARVRYGLWLAASMKFLLPFSLLIALGGSLPKPQHTLVAAPVYSAVDEVALPFADMERMPVADPTHAAMRPRHEWGTQVAMALAAVWLCGVVVVLAVWGAAWWRVRRTLRRAVRADDGREVEALRRVAQAAGVRRGMEMRLVFPRQTDGLTWGTQVPTMEPGIFGIFQPVLIWPERLSERLDDEHIEAILAHELVHARRWDNLTAALHMLVEAAFWFHPMVWWMERRMVEERERACDEAVVAMGSKPGIYAESLLKACRFCVESPLVCVSGITGADLAARVRAIMTLRVRRLGWGWKTVLAIFGVAAVGAPVMFGVVRMIPMYGQILHADGPLPSFEVATIRPLEQARFVAPPMGAGPAGGRVAPNGEPIISQQEIHFSSAPRFSDMVNFTMTAKMLIDDAYNLPAFSKSQIIGGPDWADQTMYRIQAKIDDSQFAAMQKMPSAQRVQQIHLMEQSLLAQRFKLKVHFETRAMPVYALEVAKGGPKLTPSASTPTGTTETHPTRLSVVGKGDGFEIKGNGASPGQLILFLQQQPELGNRMVVDQTGLAGHYDFSLDWTREGSAGGDAGSAMADAAPGFFTALKEELGLQLVETKGPVEVVVIDGIEKPSVDGAEVDPTRDGKAVTNGAPGTLPLAKAAGAAPVSQAWPAAHAMPPESVLSFEVATIKPVSGVGRLGMDVLPGGHLKLTNFPLYWLVEFAYGVPYQSPRMTGGPDWVHTQAYDIEAKAPQGTVPDGLTDKERDRRIRLMMRNLLKERFKLSVRQELKEVPVYSLVVGKNGPKLTPSKATEPNCAAGKTFGGMPCHEFSGGQGRGLHGTAVNMEDTAKFVENWADRPVIDDTALTGLYAIDTDGWAPMRQMAPRDPNATDGEGEMSDPLRSTLFTIFQGLGLKLEASKAPVEVFVIDHIERPSEN